LIVVPGFRFANPTAPRKLQSFGAAVQAEAAAVSSGRSTSMAANGNRKLAVAADLAAAAEGTLMR
jgi:orotidine-5'-phosphate decarboxylase